MNGFDPVRWDAACLAIVTAVAIARFGTTPEAMKVMTDTGTLALVEGSPDDRIWGVGLDWRDPAINDPANWRGTNRLGRALVTAPHHAPLATATARPSRWVRRGCR